MRNRRLLVIVFPGVILTILPVILLLSGWLQLWWLSLLAVTNALFSMRDLLNVGIILMQVPGNAVLRDHGVKTYWRRCEQKNGRGKEKKPPENPDEQSMKE